MKKPALSMALCLMFAACSDQNQPRVAENETTTELDILNARKAAADAEKAAADATMAAEKAIADANIAAEKAIADRQREEAEQQARASEDRRLNAVCSSLSDAVSELNQAIADTKSIYPLTYSKLKDCLQKAVSEDDTKSCLAAAYMQASVGSGDNPNQGGSNFMTRLAAIASQNSDVRKQIDQVEGGLCSSRIPEIID